MLNALTTACVARAHMSRRKPTTVACVPDASVSRRQTFALIGLAALCAGQTAQAATGPKTSKSKNKSGSPGSSGPSLTKSSVKLGEQSARESEFKERMAKIRAGGEPSFGGM